VISGILDTDILIDLFHNLPPAVNWLATAHLTELAITPIAWMELVRGARTKQERQKILHFLLQFRIEHPLPDDNNWAMRQFALYFLSHGIGYEDVMIASVAVRLHVPLYTRNVKHFRALPHLLYQSPY
jgi:predicted nucleic acid-binding protein